MESLKTSCLQRDTSRLEYDFQSRPIEMSSRHSGQSQSDNIIKHLQVTRHRQADIAGTSSDEEFSSTEHLHTDAPTISRRKRKILKRKRESKDQLIFGIEI